MRRALLAAAMLLIGAAAFADNYPSHPIKIVVPTPAGGPVDVMARLVANGLPSELGQGVFIENKPGAGNTIGSKFAAAADPDGYTLMVSAASGLIMSPMIIKNAGYDATSFAPVALLAETPQVLVINPKLPFKTVADLVAYAKAHPGKLNYSTGGIGTLPHLNAELFKRESGTDIVHVPYKGGVPGLTDLVAGHVAMMFTSALSTAQFQKSGKVRVIAVGSLQRSPSMPEVPTIAESGYPNFEVISWWGLLGPAATPKDIVARLNTEVAKFMGAPDARDRIAALGADIMTTTPEKFGAYIRSEQAKWGQAIKESGARVD